MTASLRPWVDGLRVVGADGACVALLRGGADDPSAAGEELLVIVNAGAEPESTQLTLPGLAGRRLAPLAVAGMAGGSPVEVSGDGSASLTVPARSGFVFAAVG